MAIDRDIVGETMEDVYRIKEELSIRNSSLTAEEIWAKERETMDRITAQTGLRFTFADPR